MLFYLTIFTIYIMASFFPHKNSLKKGYYIIIYIILTWYDIKLSQTSDPFQRRAQILAAWWEGSGDGGPYHSHRRVRGHGAASKLLRLLPRIKSVTIGPRSSPREAACRQNLGKISHKHANTRVIPLTATCFRAVKRSVKVNDVTSGSVRDKGC